jgi:hypothetical protein
MKFTIKRNETMTVKFTATRQDFEIINKIAHRAMGLTIARRNDPFTLMDIQMDIEAVHCNGNPLKLYGLLEADDFNFTHDVLGIRKNLNRDTGKLENHFSPRFSQ